MESAAPFTRDFHPLDNARAERTTKNGQAKSNITFA